MSWQRDPELDRPFLDEDDWVAFFERYYRGDYSVSPGNQLIHNFKIGKEARSEPHRWKHKQNAIKQYADLLKATEFSKKTVLIPAPTSKRRDSELHDSRLDDVGRLYSAKTGSVPVIEAIDVIADAVPNHVEPEKSRKPSVLLQNLRLCQPIPEGVERIYVFDDVLTTGGHFKACKMLLESEYPSVEVRGFFLALRVFEDPPSK